MRDKRTGPKDVCGEAITLRWPTTEKSGYYPLINQGKTIMKLEVKKHFRHSIELLIHRSSYTTLKVFFFKRPKLFFC